MNRFESVAKSLSAFCFDRDEAGLIQYIGQLDPVGRNDPKQYAIANFMHDLCLQDIDSFVWFGAVLAKAGEDDVILDFFHLKQGEALGKRYYPPANIEFYE